MMNGSENQSENHPDDRSDYKPEYHSQSPQKIGGSRDLNLNQAGTLRFSEFIEDDVEEPVSEASALMESQRSSARNKTSLRLRYESEVEVIRRKLGDLETIRIRLGLSQRKICQLLLVDPSAWTRWTKGGHQAPPHIYRALSWYLALEDKYPALDVNFWLNTVSPAGKELRIEERIRKETSSVQKAIIQGLQSTREHVSEALEIRYQVQTQELVKVLSLGIVVILAALVALQYFFRAF